MDHQWLLGMTLPAEHLKKPNSYTKKKYRIFNGVTLIKLTIVIETLLKYHLHNRLILIETRLNVLNKLLSQIMQLNCFLTIESI